jgi:ParB family chromosome partitioning protein
LIPIFDPPFPNYTGGPLRWGRIKAKTTFRLARPEGEAKCTVADGRLELRLARDFSGVERKRLEAAVDAFLSALDD